jgi:hypothetical protein
MMRYCVRFYDKGGLLATQIKGPIQMLEYSEWVRRKGDTEDKL